MEHNDSNEQHQHRPLEGQERKVRSKIERDAVRDEYTQRHQSDRASRVIHYEPERKQSEDGHASCRDRAAGEQDTRN